MPELPEVETLRLKLAEILPGKTIVRVEVLHPKSWQPQTQVEITAVNWKVESVVRTAKILQLKLTNGLSLLVHLKMTGQLIYLDQDTRFGGGHPTADWVQELPSSHTRIILHFCDQSKLFFNDQRLFGWIKLVPDVELAKHFGQLAPDINDPRITAEYLYEQLQRRSTAIKVVMLDPAVVAGLGNIYICDALNVARLDPRRPARSLSYQETETLLAACQLVIEQGIELGGTTFDGKYVDVAGFAGGYQNVARVYGRLGQPCLYCGTAIQKFPLAGRGTYWCPGCQV